MTRLLLTTILLLSSGPLWAESCRTDVGGTWKTSQPELKPHTDIACRGCREVNAFPEDIRNFMWNWVVLARGGTMTPSTNGLGNYILHTRLSQFMTVTPIFGNEPGNNVMSLPISNDHGQSATATIEVIHNMLGIRTSHGFTMGINTGIREFLITVTNASGKQIRNTYSVKKMEADFAKPGYKMPVPADGRPDKAKAKDCLNNAGQKRPPDSQMVRPSSGSSSGDYMESGYDRWWDEEAAYGGRHPDFRCGTVSISGGGSRETCGWFWF